MRKDLKSYDVAVIGAGPVGCVTALAYASKGADVLLMEANPKACGRLAGEWLHPGALEILKSLGIDLSPTQAYETGRGFVVYPDDGSRPIALPYETGTFGYGIHHERLVDQLRAKVTNLPNVEYLEHTKATRIVGQNLTYQSKAGQTRTVFADLIVGAAGRASVAHAALGIAGASGTYSRMAGILLEDTELPFEGYGHVCLGALGPILIYRISAQHIRVCIDVPLSARINRDREAVLYESYAHAMPESLRESFRRALLTGDVSWATNQTRARVNFGRPGLVLVGDAVGHHHPLTALGMTLGFQDAIALSKAESFAAFRRERIMQGRVPEMLAVALYEVFADTHDEVVEMRNAIYDLWRKSPAERFRTMRFLACQETNPVLFAGSFAKSLAIAGRSLLAHGAATSQWGHVRNITEDLGSRIRWLFAGAAHLTDPRPSKELPRPADDRYAGAMRAATVKADVVELPSAAGHAARTGQDRWDPSRALERGIKALESLQDQDGSWEGEVAWSPLLSAQYVIAWSIMDLPVDETRKRRLITYFERTRLADGLWGLSGVSDPSLFVTTMVYVAARLLGVPADAPLLENARSFFEREGGVASIPTWGKLWLSLVSLYRWEGVNPVPAELWTMPTTVPVHPSRYYCHTRLIFLAMAAVSGVRLQAPITPIIEQLREELYPNGFENVNFESARTHLRRKDLFGEPSRVLKATYDVLRVVDRFQSDAAKERALEKIRASIRWELRASNHMSLSPVSGLLNILALWVDDPSDEDVHRAIERFEAWLWEDDRDGTRVAGARSATWDTSFAMRALSRAVAHVDVDKALQSGDAFLAKQQIQRSADGFEANYRVDGRGGFALSYAWHGWAASDCTAEAILARLEADRDGGPTDEEVVLAASFILRMQDEDGSFGTYEPKRLPFSLEWMNPAEMFGDTMAERGNAECTASCIAALTRIVRTRSWLCKRVELQGMQDAIDRASRYLRRLQLPEGCWHGSSGVHFIYGTMFGIRGLTAAGVPPTDPAIRKATAWLKLRQRPDGSWGERHSAHPTSYVETEEGQVVQTAWAMIALLEAQDHDWDALERAARFIARSQLGSGEWPKQAPHGSFFHTAVLEYSLYRFYFPLWALAQFETRRKERTRLLEEVKRGTVAAE